MPTVVAAIKPTTNGLYPIDLSSIKFIEIPTAAIAIVKNTVAEIFIYSIKLDQI